MKNQTRPITDPETIAKLFGRDAVICPPISSVAVERDGLYLVCEYLPVVAQ